jgi:hypothetical protein
MRIKWLLLSLIFVFAGLPALAQNNEIGHIRQTGDTLLNLSKMYNVCLDDLRAANPELKDVYEEGYIPQDEIAIPKAESCYEIIPITANEALGQSTLLDHFDLDICVEALFRYTGVVPLHTLSAGQTFYLPLHEPACKNDQGQRLQYFNEYGVWLNQPVYTETPYHTVDRQDLAALPTTIKGEEAPSLERLIELKGWCAAEIYRANPFLYMLRDPNQGYNYVFEGLDIFLPENMHICKSVQVYAGQSIFDISREQNVCVEDIMPVTTWIGPTYPAARDVKIDFPADAKPCYGAEGQRLNYADKGIHKRESGEALYDVALMYDVCVSDLLDANPFLDRWSPSLPLELFIPDKLGCADNEPPSKHVVIEGDTIHSLSITYNVCLNRIYEANNYIEFEDGSANTILDQLRVGRTLVIPTNRPDCYTLENDAPLTQEHYICYAEAVDMEQDYTGHEPPISPLTDTNSDFCYEYGEYYNLTIYNNEKLMVYQTRPYDTTLTIAQCFDVPVETLIDVNAQMYPTEVRGNGEWIIPEPYNHDCYMLTASPQEYQQRVWAEQNQAGSLGENGIYIVNYGDTLSAIGRRFGYLPEWIAAENDLSSPDIIYQRQQLKLPQHITLYDMAKIGGAVGGTLATFVVLGGLYRWRTGGKRKRKNDDKAKVA